MCDGHEVRKRTYRQPKLADRHLDNFLLDTNTRAIYVAIIDINRAFSLTSSRIDAVPGTGELHDDELPVTENRACREILEPTATGLALYCSREAVIARA